MPAAVTRNAAQSRYELALEGGAAFAVYRETPGAVMITHTETPVRMRGQGIASRLVRGVLDDIRARGLKVVPRCPFVAAFIRQNAEYNDLVQ